jgi:flagellar hook-length control protein FliK
MPSPPPPEAVAPSPASLVKGYTRRGSGQPPFASLLGGHTDRAALQDRPVATAASRARTDEPSRRLDAPSVRAPVNRDAADGANSMPANDANGGAHPGSNRPAPRAVAGGQPADRSAKDAPAREDSTVPSATDPTSQTATAAAPSTQGPAAAPADMTGTQAVAVFSLAGAGDAAAGHAATASAAAKGDDLAISGAKTPALPPDVAARPAIAAGAAVSAGKAATAATAGAAEDGDDPTASATLPDAGSVPAPSQLAEPLTINTEPTDATAKPGPERLVPDGGGTIADRPHATATANPTATLGIPSASPGASTAARAADTAGAVPLSEISVAIVAQARAGKSRFDIRLDPPELGRIDVQLNVDSSGNVSSRLIVERPETLDLLRRDAVTLERALQDAGLNTGNGMQFSLADQGFASRNGPIDYAVRAPPVAAVDETAAPASAYAAAAGRRGGLDITV